MSVSIRWKQIRDSHSGTGSNQTFNFRSRVVEENAQADDERRESCDIPGNGPEALQLLQQCHHDAAQPPARDARRPHDEQSEFKGDGVDAWNAPTARWTVALLQLQVVS